MAAEEDRGGGEAGLNRKRQGPDPAAVELGRGGYGGRRLGLEAAVLGWATRSSSWGWWLGLGEAAARRWLRICRALQIWTKSHSRQRWHWTNGEGAAKGR